MLCSEAHKHGSPCEECGLGPCYRDLPGKPEITRRESFGRVEVQHYSNGSIHMQAPNTAQLAWVLNHFVVGSPGSTVNLVVTAPATPSAEPLKDLGPTRNEEELQPPVHPKNASAPSGEGEE